MVRQIAAPHADCVHLRDVLRRGHERRHRTERFARIVHIQPRGDHPHAAVGQRPAHVDDPLVEELRFVDPHHVDVGGQQQDILSRFDRRRPDGVGIVRHHLLVGVARIDAGFENLHPQVGELGAAQAADQLLGLAREHRPADHLDPPLLTGIFQKHKSLNWFSSAVPPLKTSLCFSLGRSRLMFKYLHSLPSVPSLCQREGLFFRKVVRFSSVRSSARTPIFLPRRSQRTHLCLAPPTKSRAFRRHPNHRDTTRTPRSG